MARLHLWSSHMAALTVIALMASLVTAIQPNCTSLSTDGPLQITPDCVDPIYHTPIYTNNTDETDPVTHRKVSGYFNGTEIAFNIYMPHQGWEGRFFQLVFPTQPSAGSSGEIGFGAESGGYTVHVAGTGGYRADAAVAKLSRQIAREFYQQPSQRIYGYIYGGSGGSFKTVGAMENTRSVWDGSVPLIQGIPISDPTGCSITSFGGLVLGNVSEQIQDAVRPGSTIAPSEFLTDAQRAVWEEVSALGMPPAAWEDFDGSGRNRSQVYELLRAAASSMKSVDPTYVDDFWSQPGYLGTEESALGELFRESLIDFNATVRVVNRGSDNTPVDIEVDVSPSKAPRRNWYDFTVQSGCSAGSTFTGIMDPDSTKVILYSDNNSTVLNCLEDGVKLRVDNRWYLALHTFHRHELPTDRDYHVLDYLRNEDGTPRYPQRSVLTAPIFAESASGGGTNTGNITGKMIVMDNLLDNKAFPWEADWYRTQVKNFLGKQFSNQYRLYYSDNADHEMGPVEDAVKYRLIDFTGLFEQHLRDLSAWVERGVEPPSVTNYTIQNGQVKVPESASQRGGIQPVAHLRVQDSTRAEVQVGSPVTLQASIEVPNNVGKIVSVEWDVYGNASFVPVDFGAPRAMVNVNVTHTYTEPGVYIPSIRVASHRDGELKDSYALAYNLGRARVVVKG
ncbi:hypothetical protein ASPWEDRAFT_27150 [Aspergillus wentii DTO 134E9]|uniref:PKD domain-containing protein n=1 Tax=Aspergillus wentii DTO 134E9 TaxID=1073089 RepID=A0A1L9RS82_ASPWE|nr:uncharacterized protein ASPWEDRAFT_27150 [Aspergillus wentii DTO 134E9]KAI9930639.1 hypothetical protein MW887_011394 [Aspergillus wentii]OJJ37801.1 hypothetical protein ASPWEDRAFT_27150 [Aspergillus wentii DTO 134E9]